MKYLIFCALLITSISSTAQVKIADLPELLSPAGGYLPITLNGTTFRVKADNISSISMSVVDSLKRNTAIAYMRATVGDPIRGGTFIARNAIDGFTVDSGIVFPSKTTGVVWVRDITQATAVNLKWFGAKGLAKTSVTADTVALRNAIKFLKSINNVMPLYVPEAVDANGVHSYYAFAGDPVFVGDNFKMFGDGKTKSEIRNVSPTSSVNSPFKGNIIIWSTYGSDSGNSPLQYQVPKYPVHSASYGDSILILYTAGNSTNLAVGEVVMYGCIFGIKGGNPVANHLLYWEQNQIQRIHNDTIVFKNPISINLLDDTVGSLYPHPILLNMNNGKAGISPKFSLPNANSKNIEISNMMLTQAITNELEDTAFKARVSTIWQPGGGYNCYFHDLTTNSYVGIGGNMFTWTTWERITCTGEGKLLDLGYASSHCTFRDIDWTIIENPTSDFAPTAIIMNDDAHDINVSRVNASGNFRGGGLMLITGGERIKIDRLNFFFPNFDFPNNAIQIGDDYPRPSHDISITNSDITVAGAGNFLWMQQDQSYRVSNNINISNTYFHGTLDGYAGAKQYYFYFPLTSPSPARNDVYSVSGNNYVMRDVRQKQVNVNEYKAKFIAQSGVPIPPSSGTLTKVSGEGQSSIAYDSVIITDVPLPRAVDMEYYRGVTLNNVTFDTGKIYLKRDSTLTLLGVRTTDSLVLTTNNGLYKIGVTAPYSSTTDLGNALSIIGGNAYVNNTVLGGALQTTSLAQTYTGTDTWIGTAPSGSVTKSWSYVKTGRVVTLAVQIYYGVAGVSNSGATLTWDTSWPLPLEMAPFNTTNDNMYKGAGQIGVGSTNISTTGSSVITKSGTGVYTIQLNNSTVNARGLWVNITYISAN